MDTTIVGIDVSKDQLVAARPTGTILRYSRDGAGIEALVGELTSMAPQLIAVEATGGFETVVVASLAAAGLPVVVVNPAQVRAFATAIGRRAKTDPIDAQVIAHFAEATKPQVRSLPDAATQALADLVTRRRQIIQLIVAEGQREKRASPRARKSILRLLKISVRNSPPSTQRLTRACVARRFGLRRRICSSQYPGSVRSQCGPCWRSCRTG